MTMKITFVIANTSDTKTAMQCLQEWQPFKKRTVTIELSPQQVEQLRLKQTGACWNNEKKQDVPEYEEILECFMENETEEADHD